jgi:hypothetical protein
LRSGGHLQTENVFQSAVEDVFRANASATAQLRAFSDRPRASTAQLRSFSNRKRAPARDGSHVLTENEANFAQLMTSEAVTRD